MTNALKNAVIKQLGDKEYLRDVCEHGAAAGFPGFIYYSDTCAFYARHKKDINKLAEELANDLGEDLITMVRGFNCIKDQYRSSEIAKTMFGRRSEQEKKDLCQIDNALAWFALEEVARYVCEA